MLIQYDTESGISTNTELGSTITETTQAVTSCGLFVFIPSIIITVDRQNWRVNGAGNVAGVIASEVRKATVCLAFMFPLSSTITDGHSDGDVECPFCFYPYILPITDRSNDGAWVILDTVLTVIFDQNRIFATQLCYTSCGQDGGHG